MKQTLTEVRLTAIAVTLLLLVGWIVLASSRSRAEKRQTTDKHVTALAERLDAQVERGRYKRIDPAAVTETDSWGHPIRVEYREEGVAERLIVRSAGRDGVFDTDDDIRANRILMNAKGVGESLHDGTASVAKEAAKGVLRGVKEEVKDTFKRKTDPDKPK
jgi:hypothetical protein